MVAMAEADRAHFVLRRLHSLAGVFPIGAYLFAHIFLENSFILAGKDHFEGLVHFIAYFPPPLLLAIEVAFIWGPLLFHGLYGLLILRTAELDNPLRYDYFPAYLYSLQRITGVIALFFVGFHVYTTRLSYYFFGTEIDYALMHGFMTNPVVLAIYVVGVLAAVFHFCNGLWTFCITWGITVGARAQRVARALSLALFVVMGGTAMAILYAFA